MADTIHSNPVWVKVKSMKDIMVAMEKLKGIQFSTWSGPGLTDRHNRPLIIIGYRAYGQNYSENKMGIIFIGHLAQNLRDQALEAIAQQHVDRYGKPGHVWNPKPKESE